MKRVFSVILVFMLLIPLTGCKGVGAAKHKALPAPEVDTSSMFGVDRNINMSTIDRYLDREDVAYIDVRMLFDPAEFSMIGGDADLSKTIRGFKVVPFPYIATLSQLPVDGAYEGNCLFDVIWTDEGQIESVSANYIESEMIVLELFPKDKAIFLMCGGGGYSAMMKSLLIYLGWDENMLYNIGGNWNYTGENSFELIVYPEEATDNKVYACWRADYAYIEFSKLTRK